MIIYNSMILWIVVLGICNNLTLQAKQRKCKAQRRDNKYRVPICLAILTFGYIIFWVGMRSGVADTRAYITGFNAYPNSLSAIPQYWNFSENKKSGVHYF